MVYLAAPSHLEILWCRRKEYLEFHINDWFKLLELLVRGYDLIWVLHVRYKWIHNKEKCKTIKHHLCSNLLIEWIWTVWNSFQKSITFCWSWWDITISSFRRILITQNNSKTRRCCIFSETRAHLSSEKVLECSQKLYLLLTDYLVRN